MQEIKYEGELLQNYASVLKFKLTHLSWAVESSPWKDLGQAPLDSIPLPPWVSAKTIRRRRLSASTGGSWAGFPLPSARPHTPWKEVCVHTCMYRMSEYFAR